MAAGEHDVARVVVGELLDRDPGDVPRLLAQLELAMLDDAADDLRRVLERLAETLPQPRLRAALQSARGVLARGDGDIAAAATWRAAAAAADPMAPVVQLDAIRAASRDDAAGAALFDLACHVEAEDPVTAAALALRVLQSGASRETLDAAAGLATQVAPRDPLVARAAAEAALTGSDRTVASRACSRWMHCKCSPVERAYATARAAELDPQLDRLWAQVLELDPDDDYAAARLRASFIAAGEPRRAVELDLARSAQTQRERPLVRGASELVADGRADEAIDVLTRARAEWPASLVMNEALAHAFAAAGRWLDRAGLFAELAAAPAVPPAPAPGRSARAWGQPARAAIATG